MNAPSPEAQDMPQSSSVEKGLRLPDPDRDNITVLLHNLPKAPVLPWNHYDSPWQGEEEQAPEDLVSEDKVSENEVSEENQVEALEPEALLNPDKLNPDTLNPNTLNRETAGEKTIAPEDLALEGPLETSVQPDLQKILASEILLSEGTVAKNFEPGFINFTADADSPERSEHLNEASEESEAPKNNPENNEVEAESSPADSDQDLLSQLG